MSFVYCGFFIIYRAILTSLIFIMGFICKIIVGFYNEIMLMFIAANGNSTCILYTLINCHTVICNFNCAKITYSCKCTACDCSDVVNSLIECAACDCSAVFVINLTTKCAACDCSVVVNPLSGCSGCTAYNSTIVFHHGVIISSHDYKFEASRKCEFTIIPLPAYAA